MLHLGYVWPERLSQHLISESDFLWDVVIGEVLRLLQGRAMDASG